MALVEGRLLDAMKASQGKGTRQAVLLIDEQSEHIEGAYLTAYQRVLALARTLKLPVIFIGLITPSGRGINDSLQSAASGADPLMVWKRKNNAFDDTHLDAILKAKQVTELVVMGFRTNCCVKETSIGSTKLNQYGFFVQGATQKGYSVKSNHLVVRDERPATWVDEPGVTFYTQLGATAMPTLPPKTVIFVGKPLPTLPTKGTGVGTY